MKRKTLLEDINYVDAVIEEAEENGQKVPYLLLDMMIADKWNLNKRKYPLQEVKNALPSFTEAVSNGLGHAIMLADHPLQGQQPSIKDAAGLIKNVTFNEITKTVSGKVRLLDNEHGKTILAIAKAGGKVGVSSRGVGELIEAVSEDGTPGHEVKNLKLKGMDFVLFPSLGHDATSKKLVFEQFREEIQNEIKSLFPSISDKMDELTESIESLKAHIDSDDLLSAKNNLLENVMKLINCGCSTSASDVFISDSINENTDKTVDTEKINLEEKKEDIQIMNTVKEFQDQYPELFSEVKEMVTKDVTESISKDADAKIVEVKEALAKEIETEYAKKYSDLEAQVVSASEKVQESEKEITSLKEEAQPYVDILEGLVTFMREKGILVSEDETLKSSEEKTESPEESEELKKLTDEMSKVINEQKAKIDEAVARIQALEDEKKKLEEEKAVVEVERTKAEISSRVQGILAKEAKYSSILQPKLEKASTMEEVDSIYAAEKAFIEQIEKLNPSSSAEVPTGEAKVAEEEVVKDEKVITETEKTTEDITKSLHEYQRMLAGISFKK